MQSRPESKGLATLGRGDVVVAIDLTRLTYYAMEIGFPEG